MARKRIIIIIGVILVFYVWYLIRAITGGNVVEPQIHYIPDGFLGEVQIIMNQSDGQKEEYENGARVYRIPKSGILRTKFKEDPGWIEHDNSIKYYYLDSISMKTKRLKYCSSCRKVELKNTFGIGVLGATYIMRGNNKDAIAVLSYEIDTLWNRIKE